MAEEEFADRLRRTPSQPIRHVNPQEGSDLSNQDIGGSDAITPGMGLRDYIRVARTYWKSITAVTLVVTLLAVGWSVLQPKIYASEATAVVLTVGTDNVSSLLAGDNLAKAKAKTYKSLAESRLVADNVSVSTGVDATGQDLLKNVTVTVPLETAEIRVRAESPDPATAQRVADAWIAELGKQVQQREAAATAAQPTADVLPRPSLIPLDAATIPTDPVSPGLTLSGIFGVAIGLFLAFASALLRNHLDRRLRTAADVERLFSTPVIGALPVENKASGGPAPTSGSQSPAFAEALRELRTNLSFLDVDNPPRSIVVTSSASGEGKSRVAANLAGAMAAAGETVIVVDGDLRRPTVSKIFDVVPGIGVTDILTGKAQLDDVLQQRGDLPNLSILGAGRIPPNPSELLSSQAMRQLIGTLEKRGIVIIDAPPLLPVTDAVLLSRIASGAIVVVNAGQTTKDQLTKSLGNLRRVNADVLGLLLNCVPAKEFGGYSYYTPAIELADDASLGGRNPESEEVEPGPRAFPSPGKEKSKRTVTSS